MTQTPRTTVLTARLALNLPTLPVTVAQAPRSTRDSVTTRTPHPTRTFGERYGRGTVTAVRCPWGNIHDVTSAAADRRFTTQA